MLALARIAVFALVAVLAVAADGTAQSTGWGAKVGINTTSLNGVPDYYDWLLCCHPRAPDAMVDASSATGFAAGVFAASRLHRWFAVQGEVLFSRRRHSVDLQPYEAIDITFTRDYVEAAGLARFEFALAGENHMYVAAGPVFGFRVGEKAESSNC
ncbi:MAG: outer membrane beta-barrel protein [Vicinamibacterales bacterium]